MSQSRTTSYLLISLCFAMSASVFAWQLTRSSGDTWAYVFSIAAGLGTALTTIGVWHWVGQHVESVPISIALGALIGVASHPVTALLTFIAATVWWVVATLVPQFVEPPLGVDSLSQYLVAVAAIALVWLLFAICGLGWLTLGIGAITGLVLGITHSVVSHWESAQQKKAFAEQKASPEEDYNLSLVQADQTVGRSGHWQSLTANLITLAIVGILNVVVVAWMGVS